MKTLVPTIILLFIITLTACFSSRNPVSYIFDLHDTTSMSYKGKFGAISYGSYKRGAYDGSSYHIVCDSTQHISINEMKPCRGLHQNEIDFYKCNVQVNASGDTLNVDLNTPYDHIYLISVDKGATIHTLSSTASIQITSESLAKDDVSYHFNDLGPSVVALPKGIDHKEVYKPIHPRSTVAVFTSFQIVSEGLTLDLPEGDYVIIGGRSIDASID